MSPTIQALPMDKGRVFEVLKAVAAPLTGDAFLQNLVQQLGTLFQAETAFIARRMDPESTKVRGVAVWKNGKRSDTWEFDLEGNPCHRVYEGEPIYFPCGVAENFSGKRESGYESFVGYPLRGNRGEVIGHVAVYSSKVLQETDEWLALCGLFAARAETEILRQHYEDELERTIRKLRDLDALKNEFISTAAHDLRSPLGAVRGIADMLSRMEMDRPRQVDWLENIVTAADRMTELVNRYLNYASIESGSLELDKTDVDLASLIEDRIALRRLIAADRNVEITDDCPPGITCSIDPDRLGQVIDNILDNAIKFSPKGGTVDVRAWLDAGGETVSVSVSDDGPGIPEGMAEKMFLPFETAGGPPQEETPQTGKSFGLGLMISKRVVDAHGGRIEVTQSPGGGACFTVVVPRT